VFSAVLMEIDVFWRGLVVLGCLGSVYAELARFYSSFVFMCHSNIRDMVLLGRLVTAFRLVCGTRRFVVLFSRAHHVFMSFT
jgi:hypothetical protein